MDHTPHLNLPFIRECIAVRAYELYEARGRRDGHDVEDWISAEREILSSESQFEPIAVVEDEDVRLAYRVGQS